LVIPRRGLLALAGLAGLASTRVRAATTQVGPRDLSFPRDHGAHPDTGIEWWYATGWLHDAQAATDAPAFGFQLTFFRSRTGLAETLNSRFAARQLLFAHAALTDLAGQRLVHAERIARWNGDAAAVRAAASLADTRVHIDDWRLQRDSGTYRAALGDETAGFAYRLTLATTQPLLLQGDAGFSRKGPDAAQASHYVSEPQLVVSGELRHGGRALAVRGSAWLDHEWSNSLLPTGAVGWDWIGINLADGGALTAFQLRRADGSAVWAGGSHRPRSGNTRAFAADEVRFEPLAHWSSAATRARYPVRWRVHTPAGVFELRALLEAQELDGRASLGTVYWEGLSELRDAAGSRLGLGYLEMTGYASPLRL
jgi:predicted secreted hydrolase